MRDHADIEAGDSYLADMKEARDSTAVLKLKLITLRASDPGVLVFVFEGIDDKKVYFHWIHRVHGEITYEPLVCGGKGTLLRFMSSLMRDRSGAARGVYYFLDRDFDDLRGAEPHDNIFMTDMYSLENYLVSESVLNELLKDELHCHAEPVCRRRVLELFTSQYDGFLEITKPLNFRIFLARRLAIEQLEPFPDRINLLANVELTSVQGSGRAVGDLVRLQREPVQEEVDRLTGEFEQLEPRRRYRGKFALQFFFRWLRLLVQDRNSAVTQCFPELVGSGFRAREAITLDSMAARASLPNGLAVFIGRLAAEPHFV